MPIATSYQEVLRRWVEFTQYASGVFQDGLIEFGITCSMSRKGSCRDNALTESLFNSLKNERVHVARYATREVATVDLFDYIEVFCNRSRKHSTLGFVSPTRFLAGWISGQHVRAVAA